MKKLLSVLSSTLQGGLRGGLLILALLATTSLWAYDFQSGDLFYTITNGIGPYTVSVSRERANAWNYYQLPDSVIIPSSVIYNDLTFSVTGIDNSAFEDCDNLVSIVIPESVTTIGGAAFKYCPSLTSVTILGNINELFSNTFEGCRRLKSIVLPESITSIGYGAFRDCSSLTSFTIGDNVTTIADGAFNGCSQLKSINLPKSVTYIGGGVFNETGILDNADYWENDVLYIDDCLIKANESLIGNCTIKESTRLVAKNAFSNCKFLSSITLNANNIIENSLLFSEIRSQIISFTFGDKIDTIPAKLCKGMEKLMTVNISNPESVTTIGNSAFSGCSSLTSISIPNSVTSIGEEAFDNCSSLTSVTIGNSVTSIGDYAFYNCSSLTSISIPNSVTSIGYSAFNGCSSLTSITIGESVKSIGNYAFKYCSSLTSIVWNIKNYADFSSYSYSPFYDIRSQITSFTFGNSVEYIPSYLCYGMTHLQSIVIPEGVTSIGSSAFDDCSSLTSITIGNSVTSIGNFAFYDCSSLTSISIPNSVTSIGYSVFSGCSSLSSVHWNAINCDNISDAPFDNILTQITSFTFGDAVESIPAYLCYGMTNLQSLTIPNSVTSIGDYAFYDCSSLTSISIPNSVSKIEKYTFSGCSSLTSVTIGNSVTSIGDYAFRNCSSLTSISIPNSVTTIEKDAFSGCSALTSITLTAPTMEAFCHGTANQLIDLEIYRNIQIDGNEVTEIVIPESVDSIQSKAFYMCNISSITIPNSVTSIGERAFSGCSSLTSITIPNSVSKIEKYTFSGCFSLTSITIPNSVTSIGERAFFGCSSLTSISIPNSVTSIGERAFYNCSSLTSVTIGNSVTSIGDYAFNNCSSLSSVHWNAINYDNISSSSDAPFDYILTQITSFTFGDAVESIPAYLCCGMKNLQSLTIPNSVTSIGECAFYDCSSLTSVTIGNSVTSIGGSAFSYCSAISDITITADSMEEYLNGYTNKLCYYYGSSLKSAKRHLSIDNEIITNVVIPENIDTINSYAFYNCSDIRSLTLHDNVYLNEKPFSGCDSIQSITIIAPSIEQYCQSTINDNLYDNKLTNAERNIIIDGQKITDLVIPESVTTISEYLFYNSTSLTSLALPNSVASVKEGAFYGCENLDAIYQTSSTPPTISTATLSSLPVCYIPYGSLTAYEKSGWAAQVSKFVEEPLGGYQLFYTSSDGKIITPSVAKAFNAAIINNVYENGQGIITFDGPIHTIKTGAFENCSTLTSITIPVSIKRIEDRAFANCSALGVVDVKCITPPTLGEEAFTSAPTCYIPCGTKHFYNVSTWAEQVSEFIVEDCGGKQIFYTTVDGNIITPSTADLGANLVSNVYEFGQGIMTFDAPVTHMAGFSNCNTLTSITIPESVTTVGGSCFGSCSLLTSIVWNAKHVEQVKWGGGSWLGAPLPAYDMFEGVRSQITSFVFGESVEYIPDYLCYNMENLREIIIPESVQGIGTYAFSRCSALTSAVIGNNVKTIGEHAFSYCSSLTSTTIGKSVITIGEEAFRDCSALTSIVIPDSVLAIENSTFFNCSALTSVTLNNSLISIYDYAFMDCSSLTSITIPENVTYIGSRVFYDCSALTSVTWNAMDCGDFVDYYSDGRKDPRSRFEGCPITSVTFGDNVEYIPGALCYQMTDIQSIELPENVYSIGDYAFYGCSSLTSITIPEHVYSMGERAFYGCSSLTSITIPENVSSIGGYAFSYCSSLKTVAWNAINPEEIIIEQGSSIVSPFSNSPIESLIIGDRVTYIPKKLCDNCSTLTSVTIGKKVKEIGADAFYGCSALAQTNYTGDIAGWCQIALGSFSSNPTYNSKNLFINGEEVKDVVIPNTVTSISSCAFYNCEKISSLTISENVKSIGYNAFGGCKKLFDIYCYPTTPPEAQENSFTNYNVNLYVPCESLKDYQMDMVFGSFKYIQCLEDTPPSEPQDTTIYYPTEYGAICEGDEYYWRGTQITEAGTYTYVEIVEEEDYIYHNIYTLELTVQPSETVVLVEEAYDSYEWHGVVYTESGSYFYEEWCYQEILELTIIPSTETAVDNMQTDSDHSAQKILRDQQILILRDDKTYTIMGTEVK